MRRNIAWGVAAAYPALATIYAATAGGAIDTPIFWPRTDFWIEYWFAFLGGTVIVVIVFFLAHALLNRQLTVTSRVIWAVAILLASPLTIFLYWWVKSESQPNPALNTDAERPQRAG